MVATPKMQAEKVVLFGSVCMAAPFDAESAIAEFMIDSTRTSLQLPQGLTPPQRKLAKKLVDQQPALRCESYGFGAERQLHVFKNEKSSGLASTGLGGVVNVKNTFIDNWIVDEADKDPVESMVFRSMPPSLSGMSAQPAFVEGTVRMDLSTLLDGPCKQSDHPSSPSPGRSTCGSVASPTSCANSSLGSPASSVRDMPAYVNLPDKLPVRNTFIHVDLNGDVPQDARIVQSMPSGMFRRCLQRDFMEKASEASPLATLPSVEGKPPAMLAPNMPPSLASLVPVGTNVVIEGLVKAPAFNGLSGVVQSLDEDTGRYNVLLSTPAGPGGHRLAKIKGDNLRPMATPPPRFAPAFLLDESCNSPSGSASSLPSTPLWEDEPVLPAHFLRLNSLL